MNTLQNLEDTEFMAVVRRIVREELDRSRRITVTVSGKTIAGIIARTQARKKKK